MRKMMMAIGVSMISLCTLAQVSENFEIEIKGMGTQLEARATNIPEGFDCHEFLPGSEVYAFFTRSYQPFVSFFTNSSAAFVKIPGKVQSCGCIWSEGESLCVGDNHAVLGNIVAVDPREEGWVVVRRAARALSYYALDGLPEFMEYLRNNGRSALH